jgi:replicative DNA helicase
MTAEKSVLSAAMQESWAAKQVVDRMDERDFQNEANRAIFTAMKKLYGEGKPIDFLTLDAEVGSNKNLLKMDGGAIAYLVDLSGFAVSAVNTEHYINTALEIGREYRIQRVAATLDQTAEPSLTVLERLVEAERATLKPVGDNNEPMQAVADYMDDLCDGAELSLFTTGLPTLDNDMGGLPRGSLSIIAARTRQGKTTLALNFMVHNIRSKHKTAFFSLEMTRKQILDRISSMTTNTPYSMIHKRVLQEGHRQVICNELPELAAGTRMNILDSVHSVSGIISEIERIKPDILFIDYVQKIRPDRYTESRHHDIEAIIDRLKEAAVRYDCHICVLSQINRAGSDKPRLENMKESGALEEGGDIVMILHRENGPDGRTPGEIGVLMVEKHKYGETGFVDVFFKGKYQQFSESAKGAAI